MRRGLKKGGPPYDGGEKGHKWQRGKRKGRGGPGRVQYKGRGTWGGGGRQARGQGWGLCEQRTRRRGSVGMKKGRPQPSGKKKKKGVTASLKSPNLFLEKKLQPCEKKGGEGGVSQKACCEGLLME